MQKKRKPTSVKSILESGHHCAVIPKAGHTSHFCRTSLQQWPEDEKGFTPLLAVSCSKHVVLVLAPRQCGGTGRRPIFVNERDLELYAGSDAPADATEQELEDVKSIDRTSADFRESSRQKYEEMRRVIHLPPAPEIPSLAPAAAAAA